MKTQGMCGFIPCEIGDKVRITSEGFPIAGIVTDIFFIQRVSDATAWFCLELDGRIELLALDGNDRVEVIA